MVNEWILANGEPQKAEKLEVMTFSLGEVGKLKELDGVILRNENGTHLVTKEAPLAIGGCRYDDDRIAVVRIIGGKVLMGGAYDIYALTPENAAKRLKTPVVAKLSPIQKLELTPIFDAASAVTAYITPKEIREVIVITPEMISQNGGNPVPCHNEWDAEGVHTPLVEGDVFVVSDKGTAKGYRIGAEEFAETHKLIVPTKIIDKLP